MGMARNQSKSMNDLESGTFPHVTTKHSSEKTTDCNNDLVLQGITSLQKDLGEVKGDIKSIKTDVSDTKGDIKVINNRLEVLDKTVGKNSDIINTLSNKAYLIYGGLVVLVFVIPYITNLLE
jgi:archaellum component FlaC